MGVSGKGQVHDVFNTTVGELTAQAKAQAKAARGSGLRPWNRPAAAPATLDVPGTTAGFDRTAIDANYNRCIADAANPGTVGDVISLKTQGDYVAAMERAYRARHCTPARLIGFMAARRAGHGDPAGVFQGGALRFATDALKAGQTS
jgi:hypothetical protein